MSIATSVCSFTAQMLAMVSLPFFLQSVCGRSEVDTGLLLTAWPVAIIFVAPLAGLLVERVHAGVLGGIGMSQLISKFMDTPTALSVPAILVAVVFSVLIGLIFGLVPAVKASKLNPIEALRRE